MRLVISSFALLVACSGVPPMPEPDAGPPDAGCEPRACGARECGDLDDGCGGSLSCGCPDGTVCGFSTPNVCGAECATDADCVIGTVCDLTTAACTAGCRTGSHIAVDIPLVRVALDVTLDGAPLPALREGESSPQLIFHPAGVPSLGSAVDVYDPATSPEPRRLEVSLAPGAFEVYLGYGPTEPPWPVGRERPLGVVVVEQDTVSVPIDIATHEVTFRVTMDGAPLPDDFARGTPELRLVRFYGAPPQAVLPLGDGAGPVHERTLRVVDQTLAVSFVRGDASPATWPASGTVIEELDLAVASIVNIDIQRARLSVTLTRDGALPPDGVGLVIHDTTGEAYYDVDHSLGPLVGGSASAWVLPGHYELRSVAGPSDWPDGIWTLAEMTIVDDTTVDLDARPLLVHIAVRLDTALASDCAVGGRVGMAGRLLQIGAGGTSRETDAWVFPGTHTPIYHPPISSSCPRDGVWPASVAALPPVEIVDASPVTLVVPRARATFRVRVDGSAPRPFPFFVDEGISPPNLEIGFDDGRFGDRVPVFLYGFDGTTLQPVEPAVTLVPQTYRIGYRRYGTAPSDQWPLGVRWIDDAVVIESDTDVPIELETIPIRVDVTLNGGPLPENPGDSWGGGGWPTGIELSGARSYVKLLPWHTGGTLEARVFRERYDVDYGLSAGFTVRAEGPLPPPELPLGCWEP